jgi:hypothetical protein
MLFSEPQEPLPVCRRLAPDDLPEGTQPCLPGDDAHDTCGLHHIRASVLVSVLTGLRSVVAHQAHGWGVTHVFERIPRDIVGDVRLPAQPIIPDGIWESGRAIHTSKYSLTHLLYTLPLVKCSRFPHSPTMVYSPRGTTS